MCLDRLITDAEEDFSGRREKRGQLSAGSWVFLEQRRYVGRPVVGGHSESRTMCCLSWRKYGMMVTISDFRVPATWVPVLTAPL
jgi:hypothetical protein